MWSEDSMRILDEALADAVEQARTLGNTKPRPKRRPFEMRCNGLPQVIGGTPYMLRLTNPSGFDANVRGHVVVEQHPDTRLTRITVEAQMSTSARPGYVVSSVNTFHAQALGRDRFTWHVFGLQAWRRTSDGTNKQGPAAFRFDLFAPETI